jgi:hypothetical protein
VSTATLLVPCGVALFFPTTTTTTTTSVLISDEERAEESVDWPAAKIVLARVISVVDTS